MLRSWRDSLIRAVQQTTNAEMFARAWLGWEPHEGQRQWLLAPRRSTMVLVAGRRWGKSEVAGVQALYYAVFRPGMRQGIISITLDQARLAYDVALAMLQRQPVLGELVEKVRDTPFPTIRFRHGSEITVRTAAREGVYLRGHRFDRAIVDEADYIQGNIINNVIRMTLADTGGQLVLLSTPRSRRGVVYYEMQRGLAGADDVYVQHGRTFDNPHIDADYVNSLRDRMTASAWEREVEGIYVSEDESVFRWEDVIRAYEEADWVLPEEWRDNRRYVAGWDLAKAVDWTVGIVLDVTERPWRLVHFERFQRAPWPAVAARIREVHNRWRCSQTVIDATGIGEAVLDEVRDIAQGYVFTGRSKTDLITGLQVALERGEVRFPFIRDLVDELQAYAWDDRDLVTDCVMALALAVWAGGPRHGVEFAPSIWG